jgi:hypothetical protein
MVYITILKLHTIPQGQEMISNKLIFNKSGNNGPISLHKIKSIVNTLYDTSGCP